MDQAAGNHASDSRLLNLPPRRLILRRGCVLIAAFTLLTPLAGCRMCADCGDLDYPAYGGAWARTRPDAGRVGSIFDPAGGKVAKLESRDAPNKPDVLERQEQIERDGNPSDTAPTDDNGGEGNADPDKSIGDPNQDKMDVNTIPGEPLPPLLR